MLISFSDVVLAEMLTTRVMIIMSPRLGTAGTVPGKGMMIGIILGAVETAEIGTTTTSVIEMITTEIDVIEDQGALGGELGGEERGLF